MTMNFRPLYLMLAAVGFIIITSCQNSHRPDNITIKIIETTDIHGAIFPHDLINDEALDFSLAHIAGFVKKQRSTPGQEVILLDNGDILQGDPVIYFYNFIKTDEPHIVSRVMNEMQYDAATVGNHDIEPGPDVYNRIRKEFSFPFLAANAVDKNSGEPFFEPYKIIKRQGVKIAVLGLITPAIPKWLPENTWQGIEFQDMIESAKKWVAIIQDKEKPDLVIGLFHAGVDYTYAGQNADTPFNENASQLIAEQVPGFDVVFVGHDHKSNHKTVTNTNGDEVLILGSRNNARQVAVATIQMNLTQDNIYAKEISGELLEISEQKADEEFMAKFDLYLQRAKVWVAEPVAGITTYLSTYPVLFGDAAFTDIVHQVQLDITGADISFTSSQSFELEIDEGILTVRDMFKFQRYENKLYTMTLTGQEIRDFLEYSAGLWFNQMSSESDNMLLFRKDAEGNIALGSNSRASLANPFWNLDSAEGLIYTVDVSRPAGQRISISQFVNGNLFLLNETYSVAINSYRGNGGGEHLTIGSGIPQAELKNRITYESEKDIRWLMIDWLKDKKTLTPLANNNWKVIPEQWTAKATVRDRLLLFGVE